MLDVVIGIVAAIAAFFAGRRSCKHVSMAVPNRVQKALDTLAEGLLIVDENEKIQLVNEAFCGMLRLPPRKLVGNRIASLPWLGTSHLDRTAPWNIALEKAEPQLDQVMMVTLDDGQQRYLLVNSTPVVEVDRDVRGVLSTFRDITEVEQRRAELEKSLAMLKTFRDQISHQNSELQRLASHDSLTGCLNRRAFFAEVQPLLAEAGATDGRLACLMVDNDHFKLINDTFGHGVGDEVLRRVASTLQSTIGDAGIVCRYGGEEFCVVLPGMDRQEAATVAETVRTRIEALRVDEPTELRLTVSIGVSDLEAGAQRDIDLVNQADHCLYQAKSSGRNQVVVYSPEFAELPLPTPEQRNEHASALQEQSIPFEAVTALVNALAYRDRGTAEHSRRVADICVTVASGMLDWRATYILEIAALLHDIGKIGVPDSILFKAGPLSRDEWKMIRQYDRVGAGIVAGTLNCEELNEVIRCFHTPYGYRANGKPGPCGPSLPLASRILAIADSYDSMRSDRSYRKGRSHEQCAAELRRYAGIQFDPELVEHFIQEMNESPRTTNQPSEAMTRTTALQFGMHIERLSRAIEARDAEGLRSLAEKLVTMAREHRIEPIAQAAESLRMAADDENTQWMRLLTDTHTLLELCRATQNLFLTPSEITPTSATSLTSTSVG